MNLLQKHCCQSPLPSSSFLNKFVHLQMFKFPIQISVFLLHIGLNFQFKNSLMDLRSLCLLLLSSTMNVQSLLFYYILFYSIKVRKYKQPCHKLWDLTPLLVVQLCAINSQLISLQVGCCLKKMPDNRCVIKEVMGRNIVC